MKKLISLLLIILTLSSCKQLIKNEKINITASIFPLYDFAREIGKDKVSVKLLLPPGVEAHSYEPTPNNIITISESDIFVYIGPEMEHWIDKILKSIINKKLIIIESDSGIEVLKDKDSNNIDPHIWLDFDIDKIIIDKIKDALIQKDPDNKNFYETNANNYKEKLSALDKKYKETIARCRQKTILYGGHFAFGYMIKRYGLSYISPYSGFTPDAEPTPKNIADLIDNVKKSKSKYIYFEELLDPKTSKVISSETGAELLLLHAAHNLSKEDFSKNISFLEIMNDDLEKLKNGLDYK